MEKKVKCTTMRICKCQMGAVAIDGWMARDAQWKGKIVASAAMNTISETDRVIQFLSCNYLLLVPFS